MPTLKQAKKTQETTYSPYQAPQGPQTGGGNYALAEKTPRLQTGGGPFRYSDPDTYSQFRVSEGGKAIRGTSYGGGGGSVSNRQPQKTTQEQVSQTTFTPPAGPKPEFTAPDYKPVEYDKRRVSALRQRAAAPFRREAQKAMQAAFTRSYGSKPERDMAIRNALNQYGTAYGKIMAGAEQQAQVQYAQERSEIQRERLLEFNAAMTKAQADFRAAWDAWSKTGTQTTTTTAEATSGPAGPGAEGFFRPYVRTTNVSGRETRSYF